MMGGSWFWLVRGWRRERGCLCRCGIEQGTAKKGAEIGLIMLVAAGCALWGFRVKMRVLRVGVATGCESELG